MEVSEKLYFSEDYGVEDHYHPEDAKYNKGSSIFSNLIEACARVIHSTLTLFLFKPFVTDQGDFRSKTVCGDRSRLLFSARRERN